MTKFSLDESKIPAKGAKVRCSKCQHVFFVTPPTESLPEPQEEEPMEDFESFIKSHKEFAEPGPKGAQIPRSKMDRREEIRFQAKRRTQDFRRRKKSSFVERLLRRRGLRCLLAPEMEEKAEAKPVKPKRMIQRGRRKPPVVFFLIIFLILLVLGGFFLWTEYGLKGRLTTYLEYAVQKAISSGTNCWEWETGRSRGGRPEPI
jgi:predicted Zn finger-like uncharacterized protein